jgi:hypothetical protein
VAHGICKTYYYAGRRYECKRCVTKFDRLKKVFETAEARGARAEILDRITIQLDKIKKSFRFCVTHTHTLLAPSNLHQPCPHSITYVCRSYDPGVLAQWMSHKTWIRHALAMPVVITHQTALTRDTYDLMKSLLGGTSISVERLNSLFKEMQSHTYWRSRNSNDVH